MLLGKKLDDQVQEYILKLWEYDCTIDTTVVILAARGLGRIIDHMCLNEGGGPDILCVPWTKSLLTRMNFKKRRVNTKSCAPSQDIEEA